MNYIKSNKFSDVSVAIKTPLSLENETITAFNLLIYMMKTKTIDFNTRQSFVSALNNAYGMNLSFGLTAYGKQLILTMKAQYIRSEWIKEDNYIHDVQHIFDQAMFHTLLDQTNFEEAKYLLETKLKRIMDDPDSLSVYEVFSQIELDHNISIPIQGRLSDLERITLEDVKKVYDQYLLSPKFVFVCGQLDASMYEYLSCVDSNKKLESNYSILPSVEFKQNVIEKNISQSSVAQVYITKTSIQSEDYYPLFVLNSLLGQSPTSLLFEEVREKNSLCYSISSSLIRFDGALLIHLGTNKENIELASKLIKLQIQRLIDSDYDEELLNISKKDCIDNLIASQDHAFSLIEQSFLDKLLNREQDLNKKIDYISAVTTKDISRVAKRLELISTVIVEEE